MDTPNQPPNKEGDEDNAQEPSSCTNKTMQHVRNQEVTPRNDDIILGRGLLHSKHPGNAKFYQVIDSFLPSYRVAKSKQGKTDVIQRIYDTLSLAGQRFLLDDPSERKCIEVDQVKAKQKIGHAIRYRQRLLSKSEPLPMGENIEGFSSAESSWTAPSAPQASIALATLPKTEPLPIAESMVGPPSDESMWKPSSETQPSMTLATLIQRGGFISNSQASLKLSPLNIELFSDEDLESRLGPMGLFDWGSLEDWPMEEGDYDVKDDSRKPHFPGYYYPTWPR